MNIGLILILCGGFIVTIGDFVMKKWISTNNYYFFATGIGIYLCGVILLAFSFKYKNIAVASMIYIIFNITLLIIISWLYFHEGLTIKQVIGIAFGILSVILLEW